MATSPVIQTKEIRPPALHWAWVLILSAITMGLFGGVWLLVQARWIEKATGKRIGLMLALVYTAAVLVDLVLGLSKVHLGPSWTDYGTDLLFAVWAGTNFTLRYDLTREPIGMKLNLFMTLFFGPVYFQYRLQDYQQGNTFGGSGPLGLSIT